MFILSAHTAHRYAVWCVHADVYCARQWEQCKTKIEWRSEKRNGKMNIIGWRDLIEWQNKILYRDGCNQRGLHIGFRRSKYAWSAGQATYCSGRLQFGRLFLKERDLSGERLRFWDFVISNVPHTFALSQQVFHFFKWTMFILTLSGVDTNNERSFNTIESIAIIVAARAIFNLEIPNWKFKNWRFGLIEKERSREWQSSSLSICLAWPLKVIHDMKFVDGVHTMKSIWWS